MLDRTRHKSTVAGEFHCRGGAVEGGGLSVAVQAPKEELQAVKRANPECGGRLCEYCSRLGVEEVLQWVRDRKADMQEAMLAGQVMANAAHQHPRDTTTSMVNDTVM